MPVFTASTLGKLENVGRYFGLMLDNKLPFTMSPDDFAGVFINPAHVQKLIEVRELVGSSNKETGTVMLELPAGKIEVQYAFTGPAPYLIPGYVGAKEGFDPNMDSPVGRDLSAWAEERIRFGTALAIVLDAIRVFSEVCSSAAQIRTLVPALPMLMAGYDSTDEGAMAKRARRLAETRAVASLPLLPLHVKAQLADASAVVASLSLIKDTPDPQVPARHVHFRRYAVRSGFKSPFCARTLYPY